MRYAIQTIPRKFIITFTINMVEFMILFVIARRFVQNVEK